MLHRSFTPNTPNSAPQFMGLNPISVAVAGPTRISTVAAGRFLSAALGRSRHPGPLGSLLASHGLSYPTPANISDFWGFGSLSGLCLGLQLLSGIFLAMHYQAGADQAFASVEHIMRDVQGG